MGEKVDFVYLIATMPGRHSGDQVHKVKKTAAPSFSFFRCDGLNHTWWQQGVDDGKGLALETQSMGSGRDNFETGWENMTHNVMSWAESWPYALFTFLPLFAQWGKKSTLLCDSPLCRDGIVVIKFTQPRKLPRHCFYFTA